MSDQSLKPIIDRICKRAGLDPSFVNSHALKNLTVQGYAISGDTTGASAIEQLMGLFQFYCVETDSKLKFTRIAEAPSAGSIDLNHVGVMRTNDDGGGVVTTERESSLPRKVELTFSDPALAYRENVAAAYRLTAKTERAERISVPLVVPYERAEQICQAALAAAWAAQTSTEVQVPIDYAYIEAGDTVEMDGALWRVTRVQLNTPLALKLNLSKFSYAPFHAVTAPSVAPVVVPTQPDKAQPVAVMLDTQLLSDDSDSSGFYAMAYAPKGSVCAKYANLVIKNSDGNYEQKAVMPVGAVVGTLTAPLAAGKATTYDATTQLHVSLVSTGSLYSCTKDEALAGKNRVLVGTEIMAFTTATPTANGYTLSGLVRGLGGTAPGAGTGERFVVLTKNLVASVPLEASLTGMSQTYKLLGVDLPNTAAEFQFTNTNQRIRPLAPAHLKGSRDNWVMFLSWQRQARKAYTWLDEADVPLDFARERYEVVLLDSDLAPVDSAYTVENVSQLQVPLLPVPVAAFKVRQLGDLLPGAWEFGVISTGA